MKNAHSLLGTLLLEESLAKFGSTEAIFFAYVYTRVHARSYTHMYGDYTLPLDVTPQDTMYTVF